MVLDLDVFTGALGWVGARSTSVGAEQGCAAEVAPFDGWLMVAGLLGLEVTPGPGVLLPAGRGADVGDALRRRGALVVNRAGRVGVVVGDHLVVQPAGRVYALATTTDKDWVTGWLPAGVVRTMRVSVWVRPFKGGTGDHGKDNPIGQFNRVGWASGGVGWVAAVPGGGSLYVGSAAGGVWWVGVGTSAGTQFRGSAAGGVGWVGFCSAGNARVGAGAGTFGWAGAATSDSGKLGSAGGVVLREGAAAGVRAPVAVSAGGVGWSAAGGGVAAYRGATSGAAGWAGAAVGVRPGGAGFGMGGFGTSPFGAGGASGDTYSDSYSDGY